MRPFLTLTATLLALALAIPVDAGHCEGYDSSSPEVDTGVVPGGPRMYLDWDYCSPSDCHVTFWVYEESNGIPGLQRADEVVDNTCHGEIRGDTIIF